MEKFEEYICSDPKAPPRLRGRSLKVSINDVTKKLTFEFNMPDEPTPNEVGYVKLICADVAEKLGVDLSSRTINIR